MYSMLFFLPFLTFRLYIYTSLLHIYALVTFYILSHIIPYARLIICLLFPVSYNPLFMHVSSFYPFYFPQFSYTFCHFFSLREICISCNVFYLYLVTCTDTTSQPAGIFTFEIIFQTQIFPYPPQLPHIFHIFIS